MSELDIKQLMKDLDQKPSDIVSPAVFQAFVAKAATIKGCTL